jgi:hypothetical protein
MNEVGTMKDTAGQLPIMFWVPASLKLDAGAIARDREMSLAAYIRSLMLADASRRQSQREDRPAA